MIALKFYLLSNGIHHSQPLLHKSLTKSRLSLTKLFKFLWFLLAIQLFQVSGMYTRLKLNNGSLFHLLIKLIVTRVQCKQHYTIQQIPFKFDYYVSRHELPVLVLHLQRRETSKFLSPTVHLFLRKD